MLKVFIADDDVNIRGGLKAIIEDNAPECQIVGEAANGALTLEAIKEIRPDVLITDIKMPVMDGVELVKSINKLGLKLRIIVLSGFDEYKYVRETMKHGVIDYLLKPIESEVFLELLKKVKSDIEYEKQEEYQAVLYSEKVKESITILKEEFVREIIRGNDESNDLNRKLKEFKVQEAECFIFAVSNIDDLYKMQKEGSRGIYVHATNMLRQCIERTLVGTGWENQVLIAEHEANIVMLFIVAGNCMNNVKEQILLLLNKMKEMLMSLNSFTVTTGISEVFNHLDRAYAAYWQAKLALQRRFFEGKNKVIIYMSDSCCYNRIDETHLNDQVKVLVNYLEIGDSQQVLKTVRSIMDKLEEMNIEPSIYKGVFSDIIHRVYSVLPEFKEVAENFFPKDLNLLYNINIINTLSELKEYIPNTFSDISERMVMERAEKGKKIIEMAKGYIKLHYTENLSLKAVAEYIHLNQNYFSGFFKKETGMNFNDFLVETRIDASKKLLHNLGIKVYEVGQMVGYDEPVSFNRAFKKVVGVSPSEYRSLLK